MGAGDGGCGARRGGRLAVGMHLCWIVTSHVRWTRHTLGGLVVGGSAHKADEAKQGPLPSGVTCDVRRMRAAEA